MRIPVAFFMLMLPFAAVGQEKSMSDRKPGDVDIQFANGSNVRTVLDAAAIEVRTPYGMLSVPVKDI